MSAEPVRITVEATRAPTGRITGSVSLTDGESQTSCGTLELLASIEAALDAQDPIPPHFPTS